MKKYIKYLIIISLIVVLFFYTPILEGFDDCIVNTLADLKNEVAALKNEVEDLKTKKEPVEDTHAALAAESTDTYNDVDSTMTDALNTF